MVFHTGKCQHLRITNKKKIIPAQYSILGTAIEETDSAKYLGVVIDSKLKFKQQYQEINKKANSILALLRRNFLNCPIDIKNKCYSTLVRHRLQYGCPVWDPGYNVDIDSLEKIQNKGARFATGNYLMEPGNSKKNLVRLGWDSLEERRLQTNIIIFHKARLNLIDVETGQLTFKRDKPAWVVESWLTTDQPRLSTATLSLFSLLQFIFGTACQLHSSPVRIWTNLPSY